MKPIYPIVWSIYFVIIFSLFWLYIKSENPKTQFLIWSAFIFLIFPPVSLYLYSSWNALLPAALIIIILSYLIWRINETKIDDNSKKVLPKSGIDSILFSTRIFFYGINFFRDLFDPDNKNWVGIPIMENALFLERLLGALFSVLFFLCLAEKVIRPF